MQYLKRKNKPLLYHYYLQKENRLNDKNVRAHADLSARTDPSLQLCSICRSNSVFYDVTTGETICSNCGTVIEERDEVIDKDSKATNQVGMPTSLAFPDKGLSTVITNSNTDASGASLNQDQISSVNRIRQFDKISVNNRTEIRNLRNALMTMATIKDKLGLTDALMERSAYYYRKALDKKLIKGRSITEVVVASIYASCKELDVPRTLQEIAQAVNADYIFAGRCYRIMAKELGISPSIVDASAYISRIADIANVNQKTYKRAVEILDGVNNDPVSYGKDPKALATAVLYSAQIMNENDDRNHDKISQTRMAKAGGISIVTLRKRALDVLRFCKGENS
jgi:transcription initiation factor TFIIB